MATAPSASELLASCWQVWADRVDALGDAAWDRPTRCEGWTVRDLVAHVAPDVDLLAAIAATAGEGRADVVDAAELLRAFNQPGGAAHQLAGENERRARELATELNPAALTDRFRRGAELLRSSGVGEDAVVQHPLGGTVTVGVMSDIATMEAVVHLLDLTAAVGGEGPPPAALDHVRALLARVVPAETFIEAATGRRPADAALPAIR